MGERDRGLKIPSSVARPCLRQQPQQAALLVAFLFISRGWGSCVPEGLSLVPKEQALFLCLRLTAKGWLGRDACPSHQLAESAVASWSGISISIVSLPFLIKKGGTHQLPVLPTPCWLCHQPVIPQPSLWSSHSLAEPWHCASGSHGNQRGHVS